MTAAFDPNLDSSSQEPQPERFKEITNNLIPAICRKCNARLLTDDLTVCGVCGSSAVVKAALVHFLSPCSPDNHDPRFPLGRSKNFFDTVSFRVACQPDATEEVPRPNGSLTPELKYVTCPKCLKAKHVRVTESGQIEFLGEL